MTFIGGPRAAIGSNVSTGPSRPRRQLDREADEIARWLEAIDGVAPRAQWSPDGWVWVGLIAFAGFGFGTVFSLIVDACR